MTEAQRYRLCPKCARTVPIQSGERHCFNDGTLMLEACPKCAAPILLPGARFCPNCGTEYASAAPAAPHVDAPTAERATPRLSRRGRAAALLAVLVAVGAFLLVRSLPQRAVDGRFAAQIAGSPVYVALTAKDGRVIAYACDGRSFGEWFRGEVGPDGVLALRSTSGARLEGRLEVGGVRARLTVPSGAYDMAAAPVSGEAGLYRATRQDANTRVVAGWVLLASSNQRGVILLNGKPLPAPPLNPQNPTVRVPGVGELTARLADPTAP